MTTILGALGVSLGIFGLYKLATNEDVKAAWTIRYSVRNTLVLSNTEEDGSCGKPLFLQRKRDWLIITLNWETTFATSLRTIPRTEIGKSTLRCLTHFG